VTKNLSYSDHLLQRLDEASEDLTTSAAEEIRRLRRSVLAFEGLAEKRRKALARIQRILRDEEQKLG
jgi:hypothetical protein